MKDKTAEALIDCLRIFAKRGQEIREAANNNTAGSGQVDSPRPDPAALDAASKRRDAGTV